ncbi:sigma-70 family RNA polymerase sigma factor [Planctomycetales bacterium ZRK34]|nr:sigma-70 family RNA polymerase sigma factor [Planctomycetales bacterium ZRK34]
MAGPREPEQFVQHLTAHQTRLRAFIHALMADWHRAEDVLQETNAVLWRKADQFEPGTNFHAWAFAIAHNQVRLARLRSARDRHHFDETLADQLASEAIEQFADLDHRRQALAICFDKLPKKQRELLARRYTANEPVTTIAKSLRRPAGSIRQTLYRIRTALADCIGRSMSREAGQ